MSSIKIEDLKNVECTKCKGIFFTEVLIVKIIPRLLVPGATADHRQQIAVLRCVDCGHIEGQELLTKPITQS